MRPIPTIIISFFTVLFLPVTDCALSGVFHDIVNAPASTECPATGKAKDMPSEKGGEIGTLEGGVWAWYWSEFDRRVRF